MKYLKKFEEVSYLNLHGDDDYEITQVTRDDVHDYKYCDGVLYQLSGREEYIAYIEEINHTEENTFYQDQIDRYKEYINDGGILETFPVSESKICYNLEEMLDYLDDGDNFDTVYEILAKNDKIWNIFMGKDERQGPFGGGLYSIYTDPEEFGFNETSSSTNLKDIRTLKDLEESYYEDIDDDGEDFNENYDEDILLALEKIIKYFDDEKEYDLLDSNHRFAALKELGKERVYVEIM